VKHLVCASHFNRFDSVYLAKVEVVHLLLLVHHRQSRFSSRAVAGRYFMTAFGIGKVGMTNDLEM
jgi:hypothetical protein